VKIPSPRTNEVILFAFMSAYFWTPILVFEKSVDRLGFSFAEEERNPQTTKESSKIINFICDFIVSIS
jgi:hypothetical protein